MMARRSARWARIGAMIFKEVRQSARDPGTMAMMFAMPIMQLLLFGFAINNDPRHLPLAVEANANSQFTRSITAALNNTSYFEVRRIVTHPGEGERLVAAGDVQFLVTVPPDFDRDLVRGNHPQLLVLADATDPSATGPAINAIGEAVNSAVQRDLIGPLAPLAARPPPLDVVVQRKYNPEGITSHSTVPGLLAIVLLMTMVMQTGISVTREVEGGTMENLLSTPLRPVEVMIGKIVPNLVIGAVQTVVVLCAASFIFKVPFEGTLALMIGATVLYIAVNLAIGFTFSTFAKNQLQAMQMSFFFMLPNILLSGFAFPFRGMPGWAQAIAQLVPATHYIRLVRGIMLKGWDLSLALKPAGILLAMILVVTVVAVRRYQDTIA